MAVSEKVENFVVSAARKILDARRVILFGSRARGDHHPTSDFDFAIEWSGSHPTWSEFATTIADEAPTLCEIDLIDLTTELDPDFRQRIEREGKVIYDRQRQDSPKG